MEFLYGGGIAGEGGPGVRGRIELGFAEVIWVELAGFLCLKTTLGF